MTASSINIINDGTLARDGNRKQLYALTGDKYKGFFTNILSYAQFTRAIRAYSCYLDLIIEMLTMVYKQNRHDLYIIDATALSGYNGNRVEWIW
jgi:hypothetical protein